MSDAEQAEVPQRTKSVNGESAPAYPNECEPHTPDPPGYLQWHAWAKQMAKTHKQRQCKGCGLWVIWEPKPAADELRDRIREHLRTYPNLTICAIARALKVETSSVRHRLKAMHEDGEAVPETTPKTATTSKPVTTWALTGHDSRITNPDAATAARKDTP